MTASPAALSGRNVDCALCRWPFLWRPIYTAVCEAEVLVSVGCSDACAHYFAPTLNTGSCPTRRPTTPRHRPPPPATPSAPAARDALNDSWDNAKKPSRPPATQAPSSCSRGHRRAAIAAQAGVQRIYPAVSLRDRPLSSPNRRHGTFNTPNVPTAPGGLDTGPSLCARPSSSSTVRARPMMYCVTGSQHALTSLRQELICLMNACPHDERCRIP